MLAGLIQPTLLADGQVRVDMGPPTLAAADVPTTLEPTRPDGSVIAQVTLARTLFGKARQPDAAAFPAHALSFPITMLARSGARIRASQSLRCWKACQSTCRRAHGIKQDSGLATHSMMDIEALTETADVVSC